MTKTLSLKLPPEVAKIMPWILSAKRTGDPKQAAWAKKEYAIASERAAQRERWEKQREEREREWAAEERRSEALKAYWEEHDRIRKEEWAKEARAEALFEQLGVSGEKEGFLEPMPAQSCTKGRRRLHSQLRAEGATSLKYVYGLGYARHDWGHAEFGGTSRYRARHRPRHKNGLLKNGRKPRTFRDYR
jgi:hypothetical protein